MPESNTRSGVTNDKLSRLLKVPENSSSKTSHRRSLRNSFSNYSFRSPFKKSSSTSNIQSLNKSTISSPIPIESSISSLDDCSAVDSAEHPFINIKISTFDDGHGDGNFMELHHLYNHPHLSRSDIVLSSEPISATTHQNDLQTSNSSSPQNSENSLFFELVHKPSDENRDNAVNKDQLKAKSAVKTSANEPHKLSYPSSEWSTRYTRYAPIPKSPIASSPLLSSSSSSKIKILQLPKQLLTSSEKRNGSKAKSSSISEINAPYTPDILNNSNFTSDQFRTSDSFQEINFNLNSSTSNTVHSISNIQEQTLVDSSSQSTSSLNNNLNPSFSSSNTFLNSETQKSSTFDSSFIKQIHRKASRQSIINNTSYNKEMIASRDSQKILSPNQIYMGNQDLSYNNNNLTQMQSKNNQTSNSHENVKAQAASISSDTPPKKTRSKRRFLSLHAKHKIKKHDNETPSHFGTVALDPDSSMFVEKSNLSSSFPQKSTDYSLPSGLSYSLSSKDIIPLYGNDSEIEDKCSDSESEKISDYEERSLQCKRYEQKILQFMKSNKGIIENKPIYFLNPATNTWEM